MYIPLSFFGGIKIPFKDKEVKRQYHKKYHAEWYQKNKEEVCRQKSIRIRKVRDWFVEYKSHLSCEQCGVSHPAVFDFHHKDAKEKEYPVSELISRYGGNKQRVLDEIDKCRVLCANCHRILHWETRGQHIIWKDPDIHSS